MVPHIKHDYLPESPNMLDKRLHQVNLTISPRSTSPPSISGVIVVPFEFHLAVVYNESECFGNLLSLDQTLLEGVYREGIERKKRVHDPANQVSEVQTADMTYSRVILIREKDVIGFGEMPPWKEY